uniref:Gag-Pol polyprotein n=1 Tax=Tanacetum cinerariifolium TaxID=118510 RepID=A0A6L2MIC8_TANCI|nr:Gag-Pol polyprotein [Tanacetum cinerariifolium]
MQVMVEMVTGMQEDKIGIKHLIQKMGMMKAIRLFCVFHELGQLWEKHMFSVITTTKKVTVLVIIRNQEFVMQTNGNAETVPSHNSKAITEVNASPNVHEQVSHVKRKTIIHTSDDDQIDSNIIFDDPYVENNGGTYEHDLNARDEVHEIQMLEYDVQRVAENKKRLTNELKKKKELLQKELETCKDRVKTFESKTIQCSKYKETCEELKRELRADKKTIERFLKEKDKIQSVESSNSVRRPKSKDTKSNDRVLTNTNDKRSSAHVQKMSSSVSIDSNKHKTMHLNVFQSNASVLNTKIVNAVNDGSKIACVSCCKYVFLFSHEKCDARYAFSRNSKELLLLLALLRIDLSHILDIVELDGSVFYIPPQTPMFEEGESSSTYRDPSNMHEFQQKHRSTGKWTKNHPIEQVIGDPLKPVMTRSRLQIDAEVCMYALTVSTFEPKNIKEATLDAS